MKKQKFTVITTITARECSQKELIKQAVKLIEPTRAEMGCIGYNLFRNRDETAGLVEIIHFEDENAHQYHKFSTHLSKFFEQTKNCGLVYNERRLDEHNGSNKR
ncbi:putative quinol monooxygenase [Bacteroidota bacterium]